MPKIKSTLGRYLNYIGWIHLGDPVTASSAQADAANILYRLYIADSGMYATSAVLNIYTTSGMYIYYTIASFCILIDNIFAIFL